MGSSGCYISRKISFRQWKENVEPSIWLNSNRCADLKVLKEEKPHFRYLKLVLYLGHHPENPVLWGFSCFYIYQSKVPIQAERPLLQQLLMCGCRKHFSVVEQLFLLLLLLLFSHLFVLLVHFCPNKYAYVYVKWEKNNILPILHFQT